MNRKIEANILHHACRHAAPLALWLKAKCRRVLHSSPISLFLLPLLLFLSCMVVGPPTYAQTFGCNPPMANDIVCENSKPGNPSSEWDVRGAGNDTIQGFATDISVNQG